MHPCPSFMPTEHLWEWPLSPAGIILTLQKCSRPGRAPWVTEPSGEGCLGWSLPPNQHQPNWSLQTVGEPDGNTDGQSQWLALWCDHRTGSRTRGGEGSHTGLHSQTVQSHWQISGCGTVICQYDPVSSYKYFFGGGTLILSFLIQDCWPRHEVWSAQHNWGQCKH